MKINKSKIVFKIVKLIKDLDAEDWVRIKSCVDDLYFGLRWLEHPKPQKSTDEIDNIEIDLESEEK